METDLIMRRLDIDKLGHTSKYKHTGNTVPDLVDLIVCGCTTTPVEDEMCSFQIDLRDNDIPKGILRFRDRLEGTLRVNFKCYNLNYPDGRALEAQIDREVTLQFSQVGSKLGLD